jgi:LysR family transcriptional regulator, cyn operon transcriptional activator
MDGNLELYRVFYSVATEKSFSKAAAKLFVTQPAVSQAINQLESKLDQKLLIRLPRGVSLTEAGEILYSHIEPAFNMIDAGEKQLESLKDFSKGSITVSASDTICMYYLPDYLCRFKEGYPHVSIRIANQTTQETIDLLKKGKADIGIINIPEKPDSRIVIWKRHELNECFVAGEHYRELAGRQLDLKNVEKHHLMLLEKGTSTRHHMDRFFSDAGISIQPEMELGSVDLLMKFTSMGMGISCVTKEYLDKSEYRDKLMVLDIKREIPKRYLGVITIVGMPLSRAARAFLNILLEDENENNQSRV